MPFYEYYIYYNNDIVKKTTNKSLLDSYELVANTIDVKYRYEKKKLIFDI